MMRLSPWLLCLVPLVARAGADQPWREPTDGAGALSVGAVLLAVLFFGCLFVAVIKLEALLNRRDRPPRPPDRPLK